MRVEAPLDKRFIPHGKQRSRPADDYDGVCFTATSGIWQPVWLRGCWQRTWTRWNCARPPIWPVAGSSHAGRSGSRRGNTIAAGRQSAQVVPVHGQSTVGISLPISTPRLWSPERNHLYEVSLRLVSPRGEDRVQSYTGLRSIRTYGRQLLLNGERLYARGVLDQGYWPRGGYTAPDGDALRHDVELTLELPATIWHASTLSWRTRAGCIGPISLDFWCGKSRLASADMHPRRRIASRHSLSRWSLATAITRASSCGASTTRSGDWICAVPRTPTSRRRSFAPTTCSPRQTPAGRFSRFGLVAREDGRPRLARLPRRHPALARQHGRHRAETRHVVSTQPGPGSLVRDTAQRAGSGPQRSALAERRIRRRALDSGERLASAVANAGAAPSRRDQWLHYTELCDVEHELCGVYTFSESQRNLGYDPSIVNAETTLIFDLHPGTPGL